MSTDRGGGFLVFDIPNEPLRKPPECRYYPQEAGRAARRRCAVVDLSSGFFFSLPLYLVFIFLKD